MALRPRFHSRLSSGTRVAAVVVSAGVAACGGGADPPAPATGLLPANECNVEVQEGGTSTALAVGTLTAKEAPSQLPTGIDAYTPFASVSPGGRIAFHLADHGVSPGTQRTADYTVYRLGLATEALASGTVQASSQPVPDDAWVNCCDWPVGLDFAVPTQWRSGLYMVRFVSQSSGVVTVYFVVRAAQPAATAPVVVAIPFHTAHAYNNWGGKSSYGHNSTGGQAARRVSIHRPIRLYLEEDVNRFVLPLTRWAESHGRPIEYVSSDDLHATPGALTPYRMAVVVGHDEYWSSPMREQLEQFVERGGNVAILSGNTMWWRVDFSTDQLGRPGGWMEVSKQPGTTSYHWWACRPEGQLILSSSPKGGWIHEPAQPQLANYDYTVYQSTHWVFANSGVQVGSRFGGAQRIHRYESDGIDFLFDAQGRPRPTGGDGAPTDTRILALARLDGWGSTGIFNSPNFSLNGEPGRWAAMTILERPGRGTVFNGGTTHWVAGLQPCTQSSGSSVVCTVTANLFDVLGQ